MVLQQRKSTAICAICFLLRQSRLLLLLFFSPRGRRVVLNPHAIWSSKHNSCTRVVSPAQGGALDHGGGGKQRTRAAVGAEEGGSSGPTQPFLLPSLSWYFAEKCRTDYELFLWVVTGSDIWERFRPFVSEASPGLPNRSTV
ncbi:hypothetical protein B0J18DRAFT_95814 [Chaetomium sp. MPI-SDFR-AT-0129]|nr:hypothetical protein B0J18DRAFT_95814 [Chaetomium sp. MPI-SDFR-AT-0129]